MGFSYCEGKLCCDFCHSFGKTRKIACPYGWCQAWATCPDCKAKGKHKASSCSHEGGSHDEICKPLSNKHGN